MTSRLRWWEAVFAGLALGYLLGFALYAAHYPRAVAAAVTRWGG